MSDLSHFDEDGASRMVDVGGKPITQRSASASGCVRMRQTTWERVKAGTVSKGNVLEVARLAGIMAAKRTDELIPLCHRLSLTSAEVGFELQSPGEIQIVATVKTSAPTGVEMEALTAVAAAGLTIYDMCKAVDREMELTNVRLEEKAGGSSGHFLRETTH